MRRVFPRKWDDRVIKHIKNASSGYGAISFCHPRRILGKSEIRILISRVEMGLSTLLISTRR